MGWGGASDGGSAATPLHRRMHPRRRAAHTESNVHVAQHVVTRTVAVMLKGHPALHSLRVRSLVLVF
jgi:hypothetical protein